MSEDDDRTAYLLIRIKAPKETASRNVEWGWGVIRDRIQTQQMYRALVSNPAGVEEGEISLVGVYINNEGNIKRLK